MWTKFGLELQKNFEMRTSGGGGVVSDFGHPRTRGGGGVKKGQIFADVLYGWPLNYTYYRAPVSFEFVFRLIYPKF